MNDSEKRVLEYVRKCSADGYSPSVRDICRELGFSAPSTAHTYLTRLINEGYLERAGKTGRQIRPVEDRPVSIPVVTKYSHGLPVIDPSGEHVFFLPDRNYSSNFLRNSFKTTSRREAPFSFHLSIGRRM